MSRTITLLASAALTAAIAGGAASPALAQATELSFLAAEYSAVSLPFWEKVVADFEAANPDIDVTLEVVGWNVMHDTTAQRIAAGQLPDQGAEYNGQSWGLPIAAAGRAVFFNEAIVEQAGLDPAAPPKTWAEFKDAIVTIHDKTGVFGFAYDAKGVRAFRNFGFFLWNNGGDFFNDDGTAAFNSPAGAEALAFIVDLAKTGAIPDPTGTTLEDFQPMFEVGRVAMMTSGNFAMASIKENAPDIEFGVMAVPVKDTSVPPITWGVTDTLVISKDAPVEASAKFIDFIFSPAVRTEFDTGEGMLPVLIAQNSDPVFADDPKVNAFIDMIPSARFDPLHPQYAQMQELVKTAMQEALAGTDPQAALDKAAAEFDALVNQ